MASAAQTTEPKARDVSRRTILNQTARLLVERGYASTSLRDIAAATGMKAGSLYYHFDSKDSLVETVLAEGISLVEEQVHAALDAHPDAPPLDRIRLAMAAHLRALHDSGDYASAHIRCYAHMPPDAMKRLHALREGYDALWRDLIDAAQAAGALAQDTNPRTLRFAVLGMMNWTLEWRRGKDGSPEELADQFFGIVFRRRAGF